MAHDVLGIKMDVEDHSMVFFMREKEV